MQVCSWMERFREKATVSSPCLVADAFPLNKIGQFGGNEYYDFRHIDEGIPFLLQSSL